jgi:two-component sensor histidine kinase
VILACWTFLALLFTPQTYLANVGANPGFTPQHAFLTQALFKGLWALLTPPALWLGGRFPVERRRLLQNLLLHLLASLVLSAVHLVLLARATRLILPGVESFRYAEPEASIIFNVIAFNVWTYWGILAVSQAVSYFRKYRERDVRLAQAQLQALKTQLHPHFLFNTLNAISELIYDHPETAERSITQLSDLLRLSLKSGAAQEVPLSDELEFMRKYVAIQQVLMQERLAVRVDVGPETLGARVPNMILQPLIENSIRHGIAPRVAGGTITVSARLAGGRLHLRVRDDGLGLRGEADDVSSDGIGLANVRERLKHLYAEAHSLAFSETPGGGLTVNITLPFRESAGGNEDAEDTDADR